MRRDARTLDEMQQQRDEDVLATHHWMVPYIAARGRQAARVPCVEGAQTSTATNIIERNLNRCIARAWGGGDGNPNERNALARARTTPACFATAEPRLYLAAL